MGNAIFNIENIICRNQGLACGTKKHLERSHDEKVSSQFSGENLETT